LCEPEVGNNYSLFVAQKENRIVITNRIAISRKIEKLNKPPKVNPLEVYSEDEDEIESFEPKYKFYFVKSENYEDQLTEITTQFKIPFQSEIFFSRCLKCNRFMDSVALDLLENKWVEKLKAYVGEKVWKEFADRLTYCTDCRRVFWGGWHFHKCVDYAKKFSYQEKC
jgi:uncharacterized protein with PIN domain